MFRAVCVLDLCLLLVAVAAFGVCDLPLLLGLVAGALWFTSCIAVMRVVVLGLLSVCDLRDFGLVLMCCVNCFCGLDFVVFGCVVWVVGFVWCC